MPSIQCEKCNGTGMIQVEEKKLSLADLVEPFIQNDMFGFRLKTKDQKSPLPRLPDLDAGEQFQQVALKIHGIE